VIPVKPVRKCSNIIRELHEGGDLEEQRRCRVDPDVATRSRRWNKSSSGGLPGRKSSGVRRHVQVFKESLGSPVIGPGHRSIPDRENRALEIWPVQKSPG
jgi:hypothetical protein